jgi:hypothetical protein
MGGNVRLHLKYIGRQRRGQHCARRAIRDNLSRSLRSRTMDLEVRRGKRWG